MFEIYNRLLVYFKPFCHHGNTENRAFNGAHLFDRQTLIQLRLWIFLSSLTVQGHNKRKHTIGLKCLLTMKTDKIAQN